MTVKCAICEKSIESSKTFICRRCRNSPLCFEHLDGEYKMCSACAAEERIRLHNSLMRQEKGIRGFLRLTQFILILVAVFFGVEKFFYEYVPEFVQGNIFSEHLLLWGGVALGGTGLCYILLYAQKQKMKEIEDKIQSHKLYSRYLHH